MFCPGYQSSGPRSVVGKLLSIVIACIGLPIFFLYICLVGGFLARNLQSVYLRLSACRKTEENRGEERRGNVPVWMCGMIVMVYLLLGAAWVSQYHHVHFIDSFHYCFSLLSTIGVTRLYNNYSSEDILSTIITSLYILIGVALVAMCANLVKQDFTAFLESISRTDSTVSRGS